MTTKTVMIAIGKLNKAGAKGLLLARRFVSDTVYRSMIRSAIA